MKTKLLSFLLLSLMVTVAVSSCNPRKAHVIGKVLHEIDQLADNEYEESDGAYQGDNNKQRKIHTYDIDIRTVNGLRYAYYNGEAYTGDVYSSDERSKMEIRNGIAIVAYANYGQHSEHAWESEMAIYEDINTVEQHKANVYNNGSPGERFASDLYDELKINTLRSLPNCSFSY